MDDRVALITAGGRGIGRDIALRFAEEIDAVAVHYHKNREAAQNVVSSIEKMGRSSRAFAADLMIEEQAARLVKQVNEEFGKVDILVNNYGPILVKPWEKVTSEEWESVFRSNLESALFCIRAVLPGMKQRKWGRIVNIGYNRAEQLTAYPNIAPYAVSKTGLLILTRTIASSVASDGITVNMVSPGLIEGGVLPVEAKIPFERLGTFADVSSAVLFLSSLESGYITGTNLIVAGGWKV